MSKTVASILVGLVQKLPISWRIELTQSSAANWLRHLTLLPLAHGLVVVDLSGPLASYRMRLDMRAGHRRYALGTYEPEIGALIQTLLMDGCTALDIGANVGYFTILMAHLVGTKGRVIAFEPFPSVYAVLEENLRLNALTWARAEKKAVADIVGEAKMRYDLANPLSFTTHLSQDGDLAVSVTTVDHFLESDSGIRKIDFVKIDVEGAEDAVIRGMANSLQEFHPAVLVEIHRNDGTTSEGLSQLANAGYQLHRVGKRDLSPADTHAWGGYVLGQWRE